MFKIIKNLSKKEWMLIIISITLIVFGTWVDLKLPDYMSAITKLVETGSNNTHEIITNGVYMILCAVSSLISSILICYLFAYIAASFSYRVRENIYDKVNSFSMEEINKFRTSSLITRTTNDITNVEMFVTMGVQMIIRAPITAVWATGKILNKNLTWSYLTGGVVLITMIYIISLMIIVLPRFKRVQKLVDNLNDVTRENLSGLRVVRAFNAEEYQENKFDIANKDLTSNQMFNQSLMASLTPFMYLVMHSLTLGIYILGAIMISSSPILIDKINLFSEMVVFSMYAMQVVASFLMLSMTFIFYPRASVSANRINEVLDTTSSIKEGNIKNSSLEGTIEFKNVYFKYPNGKDYVLKDISFKIESGETVAIIGSTGSGKTSLISLIPRLYDTTKGNIYVSGINVKDYKSEYLNNLLGYVPQKAKMFMGTIKENITYGKSMNKITDKDIKEALRVSKSDEFVNKLDGKINYMVSQGGTNLSGGQKSRLSIARAIIRKPSIYIFDDSFSALDYKTDKELREELKKYTSTSTILIVAQRIGTIMNADRIIVLDKGKIVGIGKHKELLKNCKIYKEIALSQLSKEELK